MCPMGSMGDQCSGHRALVLCRGQQLSKCGAWASASPGNREKVQLSGPVQAPLLAGDPPVVLICAQA